MNFYLVSFLFLITLVLFIGTGLYIRIVAKYYLKGFIHSEWKCNLAGDLAFFVFVAFGVFLATPLMHLQ